MFCPKCGGDADQGSQYCKTCGAPLSSGAGQSYNQNSYPQHAVHLKSSGLAAVLAFLVPGLGHIYLGQVSKGLLYLIIEIVLTVIAISLIIFVLLACIIVWAWQIYDAYQDAEKYNDHIQSTGEKLW